MGGGTSTGTRRRTLNLPLKFPPQAQHFRHTPGLSNAAARQMRRIAFKSLGDAAQTGVAQVVLKQLQQCQRGMEMVIDPIVRLGQRLVPTFLRLRRSSSCQFAALATRDRLCAGLFN